MRRLTVIFMILCFCISAEAQIMIVPREKLESVNNPKLSVDAASLKFETMVLSAEPMSEDDPVQTFVFPFQNIGKDTIRINRLVSTCSCAAAVCHDKKLAPGQTSEIAVSYNPKGHPGRFERRIFLYTGDEESPSAVLKLNVTVSRGKDKSGLYPVSMGNIRIRRNEINFQKGILSVERCLFINVSDKPLTLECQKALLPPCLDFQVKPQTVGPGEEGEIIIKYDPVKGGERDMMPVVIQGLGVPPSQSAITVNIK